MINYIIIFRIMYARVVHVQLGCGPRGEELFFGADPEAGRDAITLAYACGADSCWYRGSGGLSEG